VPSSAFRRALLGFVLSTSVYAAIDPAMARQTVTVTAPFEVSDSRAGNYLSAFVADANRDTLAAATYFREVLRTDPNNRELLERAFVAALSNGNMNDAVSYARRVLRFEPTQGLAQLVVGLRAFKNREFKAARSRFAKTGGGRQRDITAVLLTAWTYVGSGQTKKALDTVDQVKDTRFASLRDFHAGLIADLANDTREAEFAHRRHLCALPGPHRRPRRGDEGL
jgi:tetratricopeptide (TPR) repeat protein